MGLLDNYKPKEKTDFSALKLSANNTSAQSTQALPDRLTSGQPLATGLETAGELIPGGQIAKQYLQGVNRGGAALQSAVSGQPFTPTTPLEKAWFGTDQPISLGSIGEEVSFGAADKEGMVAPAVGLLSVGMDLIPGGSQFKAAVKGLTASKDALEASKLLRKAGVTEKLANDLAPTFAKLSDEASVYNALTDALRLSTEGKTAGGVLSKIKESKLFQRAEETNPEVSGFTDGTIYTRNTERLTADIAELIKKDIEAAETLARTGKTDQALEAARQISQKYFDEADKAMDEAVKFAFRQRAVDFVDVAIENATRAGRTVQAAKLWSTLGPEGIILHAQRVVKRWNEANPGKKIDLTPEDIARYADMGKKLKEMPDGPEKARLAFQFSEDLASRLPSTIVEKILTVWKAGLLTGLKTHTLNTFANFFHGVSEVAKDLPGVAVDSVASLLTGKRTLTMTTRGTTEGVGEGLEKGWDYLKTGYDELNSSEKIDILKKVNFGNSAFAKGVQAYEEAIFKFIGATDKPFYYGAKARSIYSQAIAQAKNNKLRGAEKTEFITDLVQNPTDEMLKYATLDAETAVFRNETVLGNMARAIQKSSPLGEVVIPFAKTPGAVATQLINYSPVGAVKTIAENWGKGKFDQRLFSQGMGRALTGTAVVYLGRELWKKGNLSTGYPTSEKEQKQWELEGKVPNAVKWGDTWHTLPMFGPAGAMLTVGAYFEKALKETGSHIQALTTAVGGAGKSLTEQSFLSGLSSFLDALKEPEKKGTAFFTGLIGSIVPTIISDVARATDPYERRTPGLLDRLKSRIPGLRETLEPKITATGKPQETPPALQVMLNPTRPLSTAQMADPVVREWKRLYDNGTLVTPTQLGDKNGYKTLSAEENTYLWRRTGQLITNRLEEVMQDERYFDLSDEKRAKLIDRVVTKAKNLSRTEAVINATEGLSGPELKAKLSELKEDKVLTEDVYKLYREMRDLELPPLEPLKEGMKDFIPTAKAAEIDNPVEVPKEGYAYDAEGNLVIDNPKRWVDKKRGVRFNENDAAELKAVVFGEVSNRSADKKELEARVIINTVLNRMAEYQKKNKAKRMSDVLAMENQYQAFGGEQYNLYKSGDANDLDQEKKLEVDAIVDKILDEIEEGKFKDITNNAKYYIHLEDGRIKFDDKKKLFAD